jgi:hypothetical protein
VHWGKYLKRLLPWVDGSLDPDCVFLAEPGEYLIESFSPAPCIDFVVAYQKCEAPGAGHAGCPPQLALNNQNAWHDPGVDRFGWRFKV